MRVFAQWCRVELGHATRIRGSGISFVFSGQKTASEQARVGVGCHPCSQYISRDSRVAQDGKKLMRKCAYPIKIYVLEVKSVDVAWEEAALS